MVRVFDAPIIANDQSLGRLLAAEVPVLILFWDGRAMPDELNDALISLAREEAGQLIIAKIAAPGNPETTRRFNATQTPLLVSIKDGQEITRVAAPTPDHLKAHAQHALGNAPKPATPQAETEPHPIHITDGTFEKEVLQSDLPVLVDFWAPWCGPCHMIAPILEKLAREYAGRLRIAKINVDENPYFAGTFGVQGIPTLLMLRNGQVANRLVGALPEAHLRAEIERFLMVH